MMTIRRFRSLKLFRLFVFSRWVGNVDPHLENIALLTDPSRLTHVSPCYDLLPTRLAIAGDDFALPVAGKRDRIRRNDWLAFATSAKLPTAAAERVLDRASAQLQAGIELIEASSLGEQSKSIYVGILRERAEF